MPGILAKNLSGMEVMGADGAELGELYNVTMDLRSGRLYHIVVDPHDHVDGNHGYDTDEAGRLEVPIDRVSAVTDYIVVDQ